MPMKPLRTCSKPGCPNLTSQGSYCEQHKKQDRKEQDSRRGSAAERGYDGRWQKARLLYLKQHPLCVHCQTESTTRAATVVDHVVPHKGDKQLFWDENNWQALCKRCHDVKTASEDGGYGRG